ncbi:arginine--tRNA ligase, partial [Candidatus Nomurabacteria bacterium]|nr:arginine--tRNA ligase [Candidatus Nomurabacteria bacterium]
MKKDVEALLVSALRDLGIEEKPTVEYTDDFSHGEMTTNIAMVSAKKLGKNPSELASSIISKIEKGDMIKSIEVAGPGFINFRLTDDFIEKYISTIDSSVGKTDIHKGKTIIVEHSSPNLFKPFHIGHVMNNAIGESIVRLSEYSGADVKRLSFPSDVSIGIGKAVWSLLEKGVENLDRLSSTKEKLDFLGQCYVDGVKAFEENENVQEKVKEITRKIFQKEEGEEYEAYKKGKDLNLEYFINETKKLGSTFDDFIYESEAGEEGKKIVLEHPEVFVESEGAIIYKGEEDGLHTRVFINSEGYPTYEAKDIGLLSL